MKIHWEALSHRAFQVSIVLKGLDGLLELAGGLALLLMSQPTIRAIVGWLTREELVEDPDDFFANHLVHMAQYLSLGTKHFAGIYLVAHGIVKMGLVGGLLRGLRWSYPAALVFLTVFIGYQIDRLVRLPSLVLFALTAIDVVVIGLIWHEWQRHRQLGRRS